MFKESCVLVTKNIGNMFKQLANWSHIAGLIAHLICNSNALQSIANTKST